MAFKEVSNVYFNPRTHGGCDCCSVSGKGCRYMISIHAPTGGATFAIKFFYLFIFVISIHAPTRGATQIPSQKSLKTTYFNPRTHGGGATDLQNNTVAMSGISIHAPTGGGDISLLSSLLKTSLFQSTHPRGGATCILAV